MTLSAAAAFRSSSHECVPGSRFKNDCNWCFCTDTGLAVCTLKGCGIQRPILIEKNRQRRQAASAAAEKVYTQEEIQNPNFTCTPSYSFKVDCNTCWCAADGKRPRYCTRIACKTNNVFTTLPPPPPAQQPTQAKASE